ncbi:MAG TPA: glycoside hydrolase family 95 protein [Phnomibacter sp.]|nr:glycoside hydrolase family 95 protein [Phnomibacter sp.]
MKYLFFVIAICSIHFLQAQDLKLWYNKPAEKWTEALPLGNGHIGAMVFGGVEKELIQLNESTLWSGGPVKHNINPEASTYLPQVREALLKEADYDKAGKLARKLQGLFTESYLPLGDVTISQDFGGQSPTAYYRDLNLQTAVATTRFTINGVEYVRESFVSAPANTMVIHLSASKKGAINTDISGNSQLRFNTKALGTSEWIVAGKAPAHIAPNYYNPKDREPIVYEDTTGCNGMRFQLRIKVVAPGAQIVADDKGVHIRQATEAIVYITAATSFNGYDKCPVSEGKDEGALVAGFLEKAVKKSYPTLRKEHMADYQKYFNRVSLKLKDTIGEKRNSMLPSNERLAAYSKGGYDPFIEALYFQFGRYLLISCSRPGGPPANLQGIWNKELRAPWSSNYTININTEMNYWPAEVTNLSEMHQPLLDWLKDLSASGSRTAKEFYHAKGWVAHHNSDIWCTSNPVGDLGAGNPSWANWYMGGNWLCRHLYEHYLYTGDKKFLAEYAYPIMKQAALFTLDWLVKDNEGYWVTAPSTSPENWFKDKNGKSQSVSVASTMDMAIIWDLFTSLIEASTSLNTDAEFRNQLISVREKLYPMKIGNKGQLLEWYKDFEEVDTLHRHVSHLYGLFPGKQISADNDPEFFNAAKRTLEIRGDLGTGWSRGWKINWWARLHDGDHAYLLFRNLLNYADAGGGGTYPNFFDAHPPFQIDGNFAGTAGMAEMLLQSHTQFVDVLPALPTALPEGEVKGLCARGGFVVDIQWRAGKLVKLKVKSKAGIKLYLRYNGKIVEMETSKNGIYQLNGELKAI